MRDKRKITELESKIYEADINPYLRKGAEISLRTAYTTSNAGALISAPSVDDYGQVFTPMSGGRYSLLNGLGVTVNQTDAIANIKYMKAGSAIFEGASETIPEGTLSVSSTGEIAGKIAIQFKVTQELFQENLAYGNLNGFPIKLLEKEIYKSIDRGLYHYVLDTAIGQAAVTGWDTADADQAITRTVALDQEYEMRAAAEGTKLKWVVASDVFKKLKNTSEESGSGSWLCEFGYMADIQVIPSPHLTSQHAILGAWDNLHLHISPEIKMIIDPVTYGESGHLRIIAYLFANATINDSAGFRTFKNIIV